MGDNHNSRHRQTWLLVERNDEYEELVNEDPIEYYCGVRREWARRVLESEELVNDLRRLGVRIPRRRSLMMPRNGEVNCRRAVSRIRIENNRMILRHCRYHVLELAEELAFARGQRLTHREIQNVLTHPSYSSDNYMSMKMRKIDPAKYKSISSGFGVLLKEQGAKGFFKGWAPTLLGYSAQGACKYGLYEFFKKYYSDIAGPEYASKYKTLIYLAGSASAEFVADIALCPFEAVKVRVQTQPGFARGLADGLPKIIRAEGASGLYKGIVPLWGRQIPYTMMKFATFENIVEAIYKNAIPTPKEQCSKTLQLGVSFTGGYIAGVFCAFISHPADNLVSFLNNAKGATVGDAVNKLGLWGLCTRGLPLRIFMIGTLTGVQWVIYDAFKVFVGLPTTGGGSPAPAEK